MKLARYASIAALLMFTLVFAVSAQPRSAADDRNTAPTVGTGGPVGGPTGLFTVYDAHTLRKGEYTFSIAYSNYDRDPGNADITTVPLSFQVGLHDRFEMFFTTEAWRGLKINNPRNLSSFYLPNSQLRVGNMLVSPAAIVLAPNGSGPNPFVNSAIFRPMGAPFTQFPYTGGSIGTLGFNPPFFSGPAFGFPAGTNALLGPPRPGGGGADLFPGVGSIFGSLLPGIVLTTETVFLPNGAPGGQIPVSFSSAPTYLPDAPFMNRTYGTSAFNHMVVGMKWRLNSNNSAWGHGVGAFYRWQPDKATGSSGFNMMQRGSGSGSDWGDIGVNYFIGARALKWAEVSFNAGYVYTSKSKGSFGGTDFTILDNPDELHLSVGVDFPGHKHFQPILEFRSLRYVGGRTPNALENHPFDGLGGLRVFPRRWWGFGAAYRRHFNQQGAGSFQDHTTQTGVTLVCGPLSTAGCQPTVVFRQLDGVPPGLGTSQHPDGFIGQFWIGRREKRAEAVANIPANVDALNLSDETIVLPCPPGTRSTSGRCAESSMINVSTSASDAENDVLTYNYTVSGGRIVGQGANVQWDLSGAQTGTYTITAGVDDGCGICGRTQTRTIRIVECDDCVPIVTCVCPTISVRGPFGTTSPGDVMTFTASVSGDVTYSWSVSAGEIISGQGTPSIRVQTTPDMAGRNVTATVTIGGLDPNCNCATTESETAGVATVPRPDLVDEFGRAVDDDIKARVDNFYIQLNNNPTAQGYIINYGTPAQIRARRAQIMRAINFRSYDQSRVVFVDGPNTGMGVNTRFYLVPAGAEIPPP
jgi:hypothetical protein